MGELNDGFRIAVAELAGGRIGIGSLALGIGFAAMDYARRYTTERQQFGRSLASFQGLQWMMSDALYATGSIALISNERRLFKGQPQAV